MISLVRLAAVMSVAVLLVTACSVAGGLQSAPVDAGASTVGRPEATLTAETYETAAARVTETVEAASQLAQETNRAVQLTATVTLRGEATPDSDIDILVEIERPIGFFRYLDLEELLGEWLGNKVDLVTRAALKPHIGRRILEEVVML